MKTNKSFIKRLRVTKKGKILARVAGHNHFNAKRSGKERQHKARVHAIALNHELKSRFLPGN